jgi:sodium transport system ATP-binding protein
MILMRHLCKRYTPARLRWWRRPAAPICALQNLSLDAPNGHILGLLGPNGAGKTTAVRILAGLVQADAGSVHVDGIDVAHHPRLAQSRLGLLTDASGLYPRLSARENIIYFGVLHGMDPDHANARAESLSTLLDLRALLDRRTEGFSQGERMKTALARWCTTPPTSF